MSRNTRPRKRSKDPLKVRINDQNQNLAQEAKEAFSSNKNIVKKNAELTIDLMNMENDREPAIINLDKYTNQQKAYRHQYINLTYLEELSDNALPIDLSGVVVTPNNLLKTEFSAQEWLSIMEFQSTVQKPYEREVYAAFLQSIDLFDRLPVKLWSVMKAMQWSENLDESWKEFLQNRSTDLSSEYFFKLRAQPLEKEQEKIFQQFLDQGGTENGFHTLRNQYMKKQWNVLDEKDANEEQLYKRWRLRAIMRVLPRTDDQLMQLDILEKQTSDPLWMSQVQKTLAHAFHNNEDRKNNSLLQFDVQSKLLFILWNFFDEESEVMIKERALIRQEVTSLFQWFSGSKEQSWLSSLFQNPSSPEEIFTKKKLKTLFDQLLENRSYKTWGLPSHMEFYENIEAMADELNKGAWFRSELTGLFIDEDASEEKQNSDLLILFFNTLSRELWKGKDLDIAIMKAIYAINHTYLNRVPTIRVKSQDWTSSSREGLYVTNIKKLLSWLYEQKNTKEEQLLQWIEYSEIKQWSIASLDLDPQVFSSVDTYINRIMELIPFFRIETGIGNDEFQAVIKHLYNELEIYIQTLSDQEIQAYLDQTSSIWSSWKTIATQKPQEEYWDNKEYFMALIKEYIKAELLLQSPDGLLFWEGIWPLGDEDSILFLKNNDDKKPLEYSYFDFAFLLNNYDLVRSLVNKIDRSKTMHWMERDFSEPKLAVITSDFFLKYAMKLWESTWLLLNNSAKNISHRLNPPMPINLGGWNSAERKIEVEKILESHVRLSGVSHIDLHNINWKSILSHILNQQWLSDDLLKKRLDEFGEIDENAYHDVSWAEDFKSKGVLQTTAIHDAVIAGNVKGFELLLKKWIAKSIYINLYTRNQIDKHRYSQEKSVIDLIAEHNNQETARKMIWILFSILPEKTHIDYFTGEIDLRLKDPKDLFSVRNPPTWLTWLQTLAAYGHLDLVEELMEQYSLDIRWDLNKKEMMLKIAWSPHASVQVLEWFEKKFLEEEYFGSPGKTTSIMSWGEDWSVNNFRPWEPFLVATWWDGYDENNSHFLYVYWLDSKNTRKQEEKWRKKYDFPLLPSKDFVEFIKENNNFWKAKNTMLETEGYYQRMKADFLNTPWYRYSIKLFENYEYVNAIISSGDPEKVKYLLRKWGYSHWRLENQSDEPTSLEKVLNELKSPDNIGIGMQAVIINIRMIENDGVDFFATKMGLRINNLFKIVRLLRDDDQQHKKLYEKNLSKEVLQKVREIVGK